MAVTPPVKSLPALASVMSFAPAPIKVVPVTEIAAVCDTRPLAVMSRAPLTVVAPKVVAPAFVVRPAAVPETPSAPPAVSVVAPVVSEAVKALTSRIWVVPPVAVTVPVKSLPVLASVITPVPAETPVLLVTKMVPAV